jgi:hypothetical protein
MVEAFVIVTIYCCYLFLKIIETLNLSSKRV